MIYNMVRFIKPGAALVLAAVIMGACNPASKTTKSSSLKEAFNVADRIRLSVQGMRFAGSLSNEQVTVSLGVALFPSPCFDDIDGLLRAADEALYQAKERGRNRVIISDPGCKQ